MLLSLFLFALHAAALPQADHPAAVTQSWQVGGETRQGLVWNSDGPAGRPLVIVLHGGSRSALDVANLTVWPELAEAEDFVLVAPEGRGRQWNDGRTVTASGEVSNADDVGFLTAIIEEAIARQGVDPRRVYVTGVSNGGLMTFRFACERPDLVAAVAPSLAKLPHAVAETCQFAVPPLLLIAGVSDPAIAFEGEPAEAFRAGLGTGVLMSVPATLRFWSEREGCDPTETPTRLADRNVDDASTALHLSFVCPGGTAVEALILEGGGHREPTIARCGGLLPPRLRWLGAQNCDVEAADFAWRFFSRFDKSALQ